MTGSRYISGIAAVFLIVVSGLTEAGQHAASGDKGLVLVAGATGGTGRLIVRHLADQGYPVRALVRDMEQGKEMLGGGIEYVEGDVREPDSLEAAMQGVNSVITAIGSSRKDPSNGPEFVDYGGVRNLVQAAASNNVDQFVLISSGGVTHEDHVLNEMFDNILIWKFKGEEALRDSGVDYTIVRPGGLLDSPGGESAVVFMQGDQVSSTISRDDVALVCVA